MIAIVNRIVHFLLAFAISLGLFQPPPIQAVSRLSGDIISIYGRGWGHGVGMCQEGAKGMAEAGFSSDQIVKHFYSGVNRDKVSAKNVRILLLQTYKSLKLTPSVSFSIYSRSAKVVSGRSGEIWRVFVNGDSFNLRGPKVNIGGLEPPLKFIPKGSDIVRVLNLRFTRYRGVIEIDIDSAQRAVVINQVDIEKYLYGVVPSEVPGEWPGEALKAQAIAARCYALRNLGRHDLKGSGDRKIKVDLCNGPHCQVFKGFNIETEKVRREVSSTEGVVYRSKGGRIINAFFHACCGGHTEDVENVWGGDPVSYLRGVKDPFCSRAKTFRWKRFFTLGQLNSILSKDGRTKTSNIWDVRITSRGTVISPTGSQRALEMSIYGDNGVKKIRGSTFKEVINDYASRLFPRLFPGSGPQTINDTWFYVFMPPVISSFSIPYKFFSPNGDHRLDSGRVNLGLSNRALIRISVRSGKKVVRKLFENYLTAKAKIFWDGKDAKGKRVTDGKYSIYLIASGPGGAKSVRSRSICVDTSKPKIERLRISTLAFSPSRGEKCDIVFSARDMFTEKLKLQVSIWNKLGLIVRSLGQTIPQGAKRITWDGKNERGKVVPGKFLIGIEVVDDAGNSTVNKSTMVTVK